MWFLIPVCIGVGFGAIAHYDSLIDMLMDRLREKGCLCVL
jgi:hypothetical protein